MQPPAAPALPEQRVRALLSVVGADGCIRLQLACQVGGWRAGPVAGVQGWQPMCQVTSWCTGLAASMQG